MNKNRKLKTTRKDLMVLEAAYIYCKRYDLDYEFFIEDLLIDEISDVHNIEMYNIRKDLHLYKNIPDYILVEISDSEYEMCIDKFGEI